jgi:nucleotide-binding universal stress UspA family protein
MLDDARAAGELRGVRVITRLVRDRDAGEAIVSEAGSRQAEIVVLGAPRSNIPSRVFGSTVDYVLRHAPSRVMVAAAPRSVGAALSVAAS